MKKRTIALLIVFTMVMTCFAACGDKNKESGGKGNSKNLNIIATGFPEYDLARAVVGDKANLKMLLKPGAESHSFEPSPEDVINIQKSDVFIYGGGESDTWVKDILKSYKNEDQKILSLMKMVDPVEEETVDGMEAEEAGHEGHHHDSDNHDDHDKDKNDGHDDHDSDKAETEDEEEPEYDEHVWTSPENAIKIVNEIEKSVSKMDPKNKDYYKTNADKYIASLKDLDGKFSKIVKEGKRNTLVFADRFPLRYFVEQYKLKYFAAFPGCSAQTEPSASTLAFLINKIKSEKIPVIFKIELSNGNIAKAVSDATGAKVLTFNTCHNVTVDQFENGTTYIDLMKKNLDVLKEALN